MQKRGFIHFMIGPRAYLDLKKKKNILHISAVNAYWAETA